MFFGEIVEPTTRAMVEDELEDYPDYNPPEIVWKGNFVVPAQVNKIIFVDSPKLVKVFLKSVLENAQSLASLPLGCIQVFEINSGDFVVVCGEQSNLTEGQIIELFGDWLQVAKNIVALTSSTLATYVNEDLWNKPSGLIRSLVTKKGDSLGVKRVESPNLITGVGAACLTFCLHHNKDCSLFVVYLDSSPLDSVSCRSLVDLLNKINIKIKVENIPSIAQSSNLYM